MQAKEKTNKKRSKLRESNIESPLFALFSQSTVSWLNMIDRRNRSRNSSSRMREENSTTSFSSFFFDEIQFASRINEDGKFVGDAFRWMTQNFKFLWMKVVVVVVVVVVVEESKEQGEQHGMVASFFIQVNTIFLLSSSTSSTHPLRCPHPFNPFEHPRQRRRRRQQQRAQNWWCSTRTGQVCQLFLLLPFLLKIYKLLFFFVKKTTQISFQAGNPRFVEQPSSQLGLWRIQTGLPFSIRAPHTKKNIFSCWKLLLLIIISSSV